jgi:hypothetical protein
MTIKQQGGVFGRNPAFNDVEAETIEVTDISLPDSGEASFGNSNDLKIYHDGSNSYVQETGVGSLLIYGSNMRLGNSDGSKLYLLANSGDKTDIYFDGDVKIRTQSTGAQVFGDLAFSSGNGIDFSATSGTGTSELFDDYEEGTWTPEFSITSGSFSAITYSSRTGGWYTKWGNTVHVSGYISTDSLTVGTDGSLRIGGLPFTSAGSGLPGFSERPPAYIGIAANWGANTPIGGFVYPSTTLLYLHSRSAVDGASSVTLASNMGTTSQDNELAFAATYTVD